MTVLTTELFSEVVEVLGAVHPVSSATGLETAWVDVSKCAHVTGMILIGLIASTGTFDAKLTQATSAAGAGAKDITGKAITQLADTADNKVLFLELDPAELDVNNGFKFVRLELISATAAALQAGVLLGMSERYNPVALTNVHQVVN